MTSSSDSSAIGPLNDPGAASDAARFLKVLANERRLMVLCSLHEGELCVGELQDRVPLSQSALSQHLQMLRRGGLVATRRDAQTIYYRIADDRVRALMPQICALFGRPA